MRDTNSPLLRLIGTPLEATRLPLCAMRDTDSSLNNLIGTPRMSALFLLSAVSDTNSKLLYLIVTPLEAASFLRCAVRDTNSSLNSSIGTFLEGAAFRLDHCVCAVRPTNSSLLGMIGTSILTTNVDIFLFRRMISDATTTAHHLTSSRSPTDHIIGGTSLGSTASLTAQFSSLPLCLHHMASRRRKFVDSSFVRK